MQGKRRGVKLGDAGIIIQRAKGTEKIHGGLAEIARRGKIFDHARGRVGIPLGSGTSRSRLRGA